MDVGSWLNALGQVSLLLLAVYVISSAVIGGASASLARLPLWLGLVAGIFLPVIGPIALLITALVRFTRNPRRTQIHPSSPPDAIMPPPGLAQPSIWSRQYSETSLETAAIGSPPRRAPSESTPSERLPLRFRTPGGFVGLAVLSLASVGAAATLFIRWFKFDSRILPPLSVWAWGTGIDTAVLATLAVLVTALVLAAFRPSRWAAILVASVSSWWLALSGVTLALAVPVTELLKQLGALSYTVGDLLSTLNVHNSGASFDLPPGVDLSSLGIVGNHVDLSTLDLAAPVPAATLELGGAFFVALGVGIAALAWSVFEMAAIHRADRRNSGQRR